ncbi:MAG: hypothetical protein OSB29_01590 [Verrucomicrobiota bacterium]|nr:hypothetical protein [Verrucomicrobiota bacterium]
MKTHLLQLSYLLVFLISTSVAGRAQAKEFNSKQVPTGVHWFFYLDVDGFKKTQLGQFALKQAKEFGPELDLLAKQLQFDFRKDLDSATLFGQGEDEKQWAMLLQGKFKKAPLLAALKWKDEFKRLNEAGHKILTWRDGKGDKQETHFGAIVNEGLIAMGSSKKRLVQALNVLKGKAPALQPKQLGGLKLKKGNHFLAAMVNVKDLPVPPEAQAFKVQSIGFRLGEQGKNLTAQLLLNSADADSALKIQQMLQGMLAMGQLQVAVVDEPGAKKLAEILKSLKIARAKNVVQVDLEFPVVNLLKQLMMNVQKREGDQPGKVELKFEIQGGPQKQDR